MRTYVTISVFFCTLSLLTLELLGRELFFQYLSYLIVGGFVCELRGHLSSLYFSVLVVLRVDSEGCCLWMQVVFFFPILVVRVLFVDAGVFSAMFFRQYW